MKNLFKLFFCLLPILLCSQIKFVAKADKDTYGINERILISYTVTGEGDHFQEPIFAPYFDVVGTTNAISNQMSIVNGRYKQQINRTINFLLIPKKIGTFTIAEAKIEYKGTIYKSNTVTLKITKAVPNATPYVNPNQPNQPQQNSITKAGEGVFLVAEMSNGSPFIGQPITVVYKLYFDPRVELTNIKQTGNPAFNGFWSQFNEPKKMTPSLANYNGKDYAMVEWRSVLLYPLEAGNKTLDPLKLNLDMNIPVQRQSIFDDAFQTVNKTIVAGNKSIQVKSLPFAAPESFTGGVGNFTIAVKPSKTKLKQGESLDIEISVSGNGNLKLFDVPKLKLPESFEQFEPVHHENVSIQKNGMYGKISDTYTLVAQDEGDFTIKPIAFSFFDLASKSYKTIQSKEFTIHVEKGAPADLVASKNAMEKLKKKSFQDIKNNANFITLSKSSWFGTTYFYISLLSPFALVLIAFVAKRKWDEKLLDVEGIRNRTNSKLAKRYLSTAKKELGNKVAYYLAMEKALHNFLKAKLQIETSEMSKENISEILVSKNVSKDTILDFLNLMNDCEFARYAPSSNETMQSDFNKAVNVLAHLEKQIKK